MNQTSTKIYHYTTCEGLLGILRDKCLWATHYKCLNDCKEFAFAGEIAFADIYPKILAMVKEKIKTLSVAQRECVELMGVEKEAADISERTIRIFYESMNRINTQPFVLSFYAGGSQEVQNDGLLSLWRGYGTDGGYSLEFDSEDIYELIKKDYNEFTHAAYGFDPVVYEPDAQPLASRYSKYRRIIESDAIEILKCYLEGAKCSLANESESAEAFLNFIAMSKHSGFKEENEWRVWVHTYEENFEKDPEPGKLRIKKKYFYRNRRGLLVPYIKLFDNSVHLPIKKIIVGPHSEKNLRVEMIESYCRNYDLKIQVVPSQITYAA